MTATCDKIFVNVSLFFALHISNVCLFMGSLTDAAFSIDLF